MAASLLHLVAVEQFDHEAASSLQAVLYSHDGCVATVHGVGLFGVLSLHVAWSLKSESRLSPRLRARWSPSTRGEFLRRLTEFWHILSHIPPVDFSHAANSRRSQHSPADSFVFARWLRCHRAWRLLGWNCLACRMVVGGRFTIVAEMGTAISGVDSRSFVIFDSSRVHA